MRALLKSFFPKPVLDYLSQRRRRFSEQRFFNQGFTQIKCGAYKIEAPENHMLVKVLKSQPYRDLCVGLTAKYVSAKYPNGTIIDIGANIGDTAALIATYSRNKLILVEASDYFFEILVRNSSILPNEITVKKALISDGSEVSGAFHHWGGTASFKENITDPEQRQTVRLSSIADENTCFIKVDTDGYDFKILTDSLDWLRTFHPAVIFENQIRNTHDCRSADELYESLMQIGYTNFIVWDDPGFHMVSTNCLEVLVDLNRYLLKMWQNAGRKSICNYDVLCLHELDKDVYQSIDNWYKEN